MIMAKNYKFLAQIYDDVMGKGYQEIYKDLVKKVLAENNIKGKAILELGCGTGVILSLFSNLNKTIGVDISSAMIKIARMKDKKSEYKVMDMANFKLPQSFDIILCPFDSINHLLSFNDWKKTFKNVENHLKKDGIFVFDFNTENKFCQINDKVLIKNINDNYVIMETKSHRNKCVWNIFIFIKQGRDCYKFYSEKITEVSFSEDKILQTLKKYFGTVEIINKDKDRTFIICKK